MYDDNNENGQTRDFAKGLTQEAEDQTADTPPDVAETAGDQTGVFADFIRKQPILTLSLAFGLGLLATSLLARRRS
jgi:ElaB/YqjD/DUF883 family membrane-anchored ribosome-binding protein